MTVTLGRTALPGVDSMTCPAVAVEIAPESRLAARPAHSASDDPAYQARVAAGPGRRPARVAHQARTEARQP